MTRPFSRGSVENRTTQRHQNPLTVRFDPEFGTVTLEKATVSSPKRTSSRQSHRARQDRRWRPFWKFRNFCAAVRPRLNNVLAVILILQWTLVFLLVRIYEDITGRSIFEANLMDLRRLLRVFSRLG